MMKSLDYQRLSDMIADSKSIVVFSGAGISSESGIPTYRGASGVWSKYDPNIYANITMFLRDSSYYWQYFRDERYPIIKKARPNQAHYTVVLLEKQGKISRVITQNIDGLHQMAGSSNVVELHGTTRKIRCMVCDNEYSMDDIFKKLEHELPPKCECGGHLKPATVLFGEPLPQDALSAAKVVCSTCDLLLVLGSSLVVYPAAQLPVLAKKNNARLVIINVDPTPLDSCADLVFHEGVSKVLSQVIK
ncbi:MAG: NAD-dependent deacylase [Candidatus Thermoplasmatota archaeon]|nr:NAD-dependent deacylase [Candidatus Thermoplasmatota archaeon]MBU1940635.1 NAD-dependent deacylase [Candidatus Thermoplasmatota archaeon]